MLLSIIDTKMCKLYVYIKVYNYQNLKRIVWPKIKRIQDTHLSQIHYLAITIVATQYHSFYKSICFVVFIVSYCFFLLFLNDFFFCSYSCFADKLCFVLLMCTCLISFKYIFSPVFILLLLSLFISRCLSFFPSFFPLPLLGVVLKVR